MNSSTKLTQTPIFSEKNIDTVPLSNSDLFMCATGLVSFTAAMLENVDYSSWLPISGLAETISVAAPLVKSVINLSSLGIAVAESSVIGNSLSLPTLSSLAIAGTKFFLSSQLQLHPELKTISLLINAYTTYAIAQRAFAEISKSLKAESPNGEYSWKLGRNIFVHTFNATYSAYKTATLFSDFFETGLKGRILFTSDKNLQALTGRPTSVPTRQPSSSPSRQPTGQPTRQPTKQPIAEPTSQPSNQPSAAPSRQPTAQPSRQPSRQPILNPTSSPTNQPTSYPSNQPSNQPSGH